MIKTTDDKYKKLLAVLLAVVAAAAVLGLFGIRYQTNDDATLSNIAAGGYGKDTLHMVYVNVLFSALLRPFYAVAQTNWYVIIQLVLVVISIAATGYILMKRLGLYCGLAAYTGLLVAFGRHIFYSFQYTECAFIMLAAGLLLIADSLGRPDKSTVLGIILSIFGAMVRWDAFYAVGGLSACLLLFRFFSLDREKMKKAVITMIVFFAFVFGAKTVDVIAYRADSRWGDFAAYNAARTAYSDFAVYGLPQENPFAEMGITDIDYTMLNSWDFYDEGRFTTELVNSAAEYRRPFSLTQLAKDSAEQLADMVTGNSGNTAFLIVIILSLACLRLTGGAAAMVGIYSTLCLFIVYLTYRMRYTRWVELGLIWTVSVFALYCISHIELPHRAKLAAAALSLAAVLAVSLPEYTQLYRDVPVYADWTRLEQNYFEQMSRDKDNIYLLSTEAINVAAGFDVMHPRTDGFYSNIVAYGGWLSRAPHRDRALKEYGLSRPLVDAVDNPNVYLDYHRINNVVQYVQQELGVPVYAVKTGDNAFAPYQLTTTAPQQ